MTQKIGIIGAGGMLQYHAPGFKAGGGEIIAICDMNQEAAKKAAHTYGASHVFGDSQKMLDELPDLDAISIITPNRTHMPLALQALRAGKHVFCEKPPALNAQEVSEMKQAADEAGKTLMFNFNNRARPESYAMRSYIESGQLGTINSAQAKWIRRTGIPGFGGWFTNQAQSGGGPLIDLLHMIDLALFYMDYPKPTHVLAQTFNNFIQDKGFKGPWGIPDVADGVTDVESAAHGFVRFDTGQVLSFQVSWAEMNKREEVSVTFQGSQAGGMVRRLFGRDGIDATALDDCELYFQEHGRSVNRSVVVEECEDMGRIRSAQNFASTLEGKEAPLNTPDQALALMKIIDATYESARSGKPVEIA
ncbi:Gfo/Idh/MocA family oxidoreductase [Opitutales bacterium]|jgi:predicted dehydrogenase|uniref:Gfo/Idh/MocA family protein n=1 Tax=Candidatus Chordibacter forsetii TaxID=3381758 RepID=UPI002317831F|nr:Gfo/Idh/MocA family oxidoreductase [bacterium]MDC0363237.1 Gfo/Idh/MocA family oxidoreductase [Opitutales bacterium]MDC0646543.1 Gfo/Idh/MocA family oxidoreductase [Opitutales bacterium]MDC3282463.1 Gfo/Idh/MocA family oxidoreductase [Opitutales bacterium]